ncbi:glycosyltransferase family protein [Ornithinimicrobium avium]|uniref:Glycosyl transferase family 28 n=1 Tax=Ornithinimicrobium avium TaxID=2283195 RepID=A0A345NMT8_9MICO|nr:glycosyltransferase [Ornithinimicrobium avium]AXH96346.1 glycosyl transferase family 28 [Ornithinimicrobium avium]
MAPTTTHASEPLRVVFYSHDSQGLGHFRRNRALAHSLSRRLPVLLGRPVTGLLINGVAGTSASSVPEGFDVVTLPAVGKSGRSYGPRSLSVGLAAVTSLRGSIVHATLSSFAPDLVVVDRHALGVGGELAPALADLRADRPGARVVLGLREVLDAPQTVAAEWDRTPPEVVRELFDEIWVYGDPRVHDLRRTGELPAALHDLVRYQGYLAHGRAEDPPGVDPDRPYLLTTAGGGSDGTALCLAAAAAPLPTGHSHLVVTGPQMSDADHRRVERAAGPRTRVVRSVPDAAGLIRRAAATVSMAGYNTVTESLATTVPALLVPREWPRREQLIRSHGLAAAGATDLLRQGDLSSRALGAWFAARAGDRIDRRHLDLNGLAAVARAAADLTAHPSVPHQEQHHAVAV